MWLHFRICLYRIQLKSILICKQTPLIIKYFYKSNFIWRANFINIPIHFYSVWLHKYYNNIEVHIAHFLSIDNTKSSWTLFSFFLSTLLTSLHQSYSYDLYHTTLLIFSTLSTQRRPNKTHLDLPYPISHSSIIINSFPISPSAQSLPPIVH